MQRKLPMSLHRFWQQGLRWTIGIFGIFQPIDTLQLTKLVEQYNHLEATINQECGRVSDCAIVNPPQGLECENNRCIAIY